MNQNHLQLLAQLDGLYARGQLLEMIMLSQGFLKQFPNSSEIHIRLGNAYVGMQRFEQGRASYETAIRLAPSDAGAQYNLGNVLRILGDFDGAANSYAKAIRLSPEFAAAHFNLSSLKTYRRDDPQIRKMRALLKRSGLPLQSEMALNFALGKAYADLDEPDRAFSHFARGNRAQRMMKPYDAGKQRALFATIRACFETGSVPQLPDATAPQARPVFVVGMMRSGTTLIERILSRHAQVHTGGELAIASAAVRSRLGPEPGAITAERMEAFRTMYLEGVSRLRIENPVFTDKMPHNFLWIGFLLRAIPEARIVHGRCCRSRLRDELPLSPKP